MIEVSSEKEGKQTFESYRSLFNHIRKIELEKFGKTEDMEWHFIFHSHEKLSLIYQKAIKAFEQVMTDEEYEAYDQKLNLVELYKGNSTKPTRIVLTPNMSIKELKKTWCRDYFLGKGYTIREVN